MYINVQGEANLSLAVVYAVMVRGRSGEGEEGRRSGEGEEW